ncbi:MAG: hypothetical protein WAU86_14105 [Oricola sp.]
MFTWKSVVRIAIIVLVVVAANLAGSYIASTLDARLTQAPELARWGRIAFAIAYTAMLAIPFVPAAEIGMVLIAMYGRSVVLLVYLCTVTGLSISFAAGRFIPLHAIVALCHFLRLESLARTLTEIDGMSLQERLAHLVAKAPNRAIPFLLRNRYVALALALNLPGNSVIGGGGGIALIAGSARLFSTPGFLVAIAIAVSPVPLAVFVFGVMFFPHY